MNATAPAWWEKTGNTSWVKCAACGNWFHASAGLLAKTDVLLHCPHCHNEFTVDGAARVARPT